METTAVKAFVLQSPAQAGAMTRAIYLWSSRSTEGDADRQYADSSAMVAAYRACEQNQLACWAASRRRESRG